MITLLALAAILTLAGCQQYPEQTLNDIDGDGKPDNECPQYKYASNISLQFTASNNLPAKLSGSVNDKLALDECTFGNNALDYSIVKNDARTVTIAIWVDNNASLRRELFDGSGKPRANSFIHFKLMGKSHCTDSDVSIGEIHRVLSWEPVYAGGKACGISGYTAIIE